MLGQVRLLFLLFSLVWSVIGFFGIGDDMGPPWLVATAIVIVQTCLCVTYRRGRIAWWTWLLEAPCVWLVVASSGYGITIGLLFVWINFRALYGTLRTQMFGAGAVVAIVVSGTVFAAVPVSHAASLGVTALIGLAINHTLAQGIRARDRTSAREQVIAAAGATFAAVTDRRQASRAAAEAALSLDARVTGALVTTMVAGAVRVIGHAGAAGPETVGRRMNLDELGPEVRTALRPNGSALITGSAAARFTTLAGMPSRDRLLAVPLAVRGEVFGLLVAVFDRRPTDDLTAALSTLADEAALTLDQLLTRSRLSIVVENSPDALILAGERGVIRFANRAAEKLLACPVVDLVGGDLRRLIHPDQVDRLLGPEASGPQVCLMRGREADPWTEFEVLVEYVTENDGTRSLILNARDVSERRRLELELRHAQKLESVGRLAAGIAHEINTPIQFVSDNVRFLEESVADLLTLVTAVQKRFGDKDGQITDLLRDIDADFMLAEVPKALSESLEGLDRVATIVRAMKAFGHPGVEAMTAADLNEMVRNTLLVADNELKYVADVETDLADLPPVRCHIGDINQTVLNLVVNAAHAIEAADRGRGTIRVSTELDGDAVVLRVADTGNGVPPEIADKVFDPFFTTKEVGRGTGQGLALARSLVVDRHRGSIDFRSEPGAGTVFTVRLPIDEQGSAPEPATELEAVV